MLIVLIVALATPAESNRFTPPSAETFSGKRAAQDVLLRLECDARAARDPLEQVGLRPGDLVAHWQVSAAHDTAPPSVELQYTNDARAVLALPGGALLGYLRYGSYYVAPGRPEEHAPPKPKSKEDALPEAEAKAQAEQWLARFLPADTWRIVAIEYKDRFDASPDDLYGAWWEARAERVFQGFPAIGVDAQVALDAETGALMQLVLPAFAPPREAVAYFPLLNARIKAEDYLASRPAEALMELTQHDPAAPEAFLDGLEEDFAVRGGLGATQPGDRAARKRLRKAQKLAAQAGEAGSVPTESSNDATGPQPTAIPPTLAPGDVPLVLAPLTQRFTQGQWQPLDPTDPTPKFELVYAFPTQTPTAPTAPLYITANNNEVAR